MAVTPVGNPYVESSDLVANYPGTSEALAERIDIVGVNPFADSAARSTAIPSPVEGQMASLNDDDKVYRYSGSAWVAVGLPPGLNLLAPTSIANSGGTATSANGTTSFTGVTSVSLNGVFSSTYENYLLIGDHIGSAGGTSPTMRLRVGGTDNTVAKYQRVSYFFGTAISNAYSANQTSWSWGTHGTANSTYALTFIKPNLASTTALIGNSTDGRGYGVSRGSDFTDATAFDGFSLIAGTGTITGTIRIYGYAK